MRRDDWLLWGGVATLGAVAFWKRRLIVDVTTRGKLLTHAPAGANGVVPARPRDLVASASAAIGRGVSQDAYDLARMIRSEGAAEGRVRAHVALNDATAHGWSLHFALTYSTNPKANGYYGEQHTPALRAPDGVSSSRRYSTAHDPYEGDLELAEQVLAEHAAGVDPSQGATKFYDVDSGQEGAASYDQVVAAWAPLQPFNVPGYPDSFVIFRRA